MGFQRSRRAAAGTGRRSACPAACRRACRRPTAARRRVACWVVSWTCLGRVLDVSLARRESLGERHRDAGELLGEELDELLLLALAQQRREQLEVDRGRVVLDRRRRGRHLVRAAGVLEREGASLRESAHAQAKPRVRRDDGHLPQVAHDVGAIRRPGAADDERDLGAAQPARVVDALVHLDTGLVLLDVDVEDADAERAGARRGGADLDGHAGGLLAPDERHLCAQPELASRLPHAVL
mmetsp:Transcript_29968/g.95683  ORF Transcript_29968/g.95683 Transcript_29968/m.95683 type:complete len:239 (-) Transcript_29968:537-1253(-)